MNYEEKDKEYLNTLTVLYVEDDDIARELLSQFLERICSKLIKACNGVEGLESYKANRADVVITDIQMPIMDGLEMSYKIRAIDVQIPIIVTTAFENSDYFQRSIEIGVNRYVLKPIMRERLQAALMDCAHRLRLEDEQRKMSVRLLQAEKNEAIAQLAGGVAHHFNNILQIISGYSGMAFMNMPVNDPNRENIVKVLDAAHRAAGITQGLLAFCRKLPMKPLTTDINKILLQIKPEISALLGDNISLKVSTYDTPLLCNVDKEQMEIVLKNLTSNACNAMKQGGVLSLEISLVEIDDSFIQANGYGEPGYYALISVSDSGAGIDKKTLHQIFNPFYTTREVGQGTGLGLPMSLGIIKTHNGYLNVYSEQGKGTTVRMYLPVVNPPVEQSKELAEESPPRGTETILVVDDSVEMLNFITHLLKKFGYQVFSADNVGKAVDIFVSNRENIKLVLTDMFLENISGMELAHEIRQIEPGMVFIFTSGYSKEIIQWRGEFTSDVCVISKPFRPFDLLKKVRDILDNS